MVAAGVLLSTLDSSMVNVALPAIARGFDADLALIDLVVVVYLMVISATLLFWGRLADRWGRGQVYLTGVVVFAFGALACSMSGLFWQLVLFRGVQATGAAMMAASGPALLKQVFPDRELGRVIGLVGIATSCGLMAGPVVSGFLLDYYGWRYLFWVGLPVSIAMIPAMLFWLLPAIRTVSSPPASGPFDWSGGVLWIALVLVFVLTMKQAPGDTGVTLCLALLLVLLVVLFYCCERRAIVPILPLELIRRRFFYSAASAVAFSFCALFIVLILMPFYLDRVLGYSAVAVGWTMMAMPISLVVFSPVSGWLYDTTGSARNISTFGLVWAVVAVILIWRFDDMTGPWCIFLALALLGGGLAIFLSPNSASVMSRVAEKYGGLAAGVLATARNFGMMSGAAIGGVSISRVAVHPLDPEVDSSQAAMRHFFLDQLQQSMEIAAILLLIAVIFSLLRDEERKD